MGEGEPSSSSHTSGTISRNELRRVVEEVLRAGLGELGESLRLELRLILAEAFKEQSAFSSIQKDRAGHEWMNRHMRGFGADVADTEHPAPAIVSQHSRRSHKSAPSPGRVRSFHANVTPSESPRSRQQRRTPSPFGLVVKARTDAADVRDGQGPDLEAGHGHVRFAPDLEIHLPEELPPRAKARRHSRKSTQNGAGHGHGHGQGQNGSNEDEAHIDHPMPTLMQNTKGQAGGIKPAAHIVIASRRLSKLSRSSSVASSLSAQSSAESSCPSSASHIQAKVQSSHRGASITTATAALASDHQQANPNSQKFPALLPGQSDLDNASRKSSRSDVRAKPESLINSSCSEISLLKPPLVTAGRSIFCWLRFRALVAQIVSSVYFDWLACGLVIVNAIFMGVQTDREASLASGGDSESANIVEDQIQPIYLAIEAGFVVAFSFELALRLFAFGWDFFKMPDWKWNVFDLCVVVLQLVELAQATILVATLANKESGIPMNLSFVRLLRVMRLIRVIRAIRVLRLIGELRTIVTSILSSLKFLVWTIVLLCFIIYIVGVYLTQLVVDNRAVVDATSHTSQREEQEQQQQAMDRYYGSLGRTLLTLFQCITNGVDWGEALAPLMDQISPVMGVFFCMYIAFAVLAMLNVITGVFVESSLLSAKADKDYFLVNNVRELFCNPDGSLSQEMSWDTFVDQLDRPEMRAYFKAMDLDPSEARGLFQLLDLDGSGTIDAQEFLNGCLRLRGPAKALDLHLVMRETRHLALEVAALRIQSQPQPLQFCGDLDPSNSPSSRKIVARSTPCRSNSAACSSDLSCSCFSDGGHSTPKMPGTASLSLS
eukprot:TRINITY_DN27057_c0_g1_i1.p1 TRINITY_DN27057_c0_g1~~TRINITY_DN27057_c0_g1_i1.p1  ORF type:complete len:831 (+),score=115.06 TRINITY_DN27057_c0_g1_i1:283-2775(+)